MNKKLQKIKETTLKSIKRGGVIACLSMTYAGGLFGQVTISSNTTWNGSAPSGYEDGITILSGFTLNISSITLEMNGGKHIDIENGGKLILEDVTIQRSSSINWGGIRAEGDLTKTQFTTYPDPESRQ